MLESYIRNKLNEKDILLMTHIVLGYPSFDEIYRIIKAMVDAGVDLMELQIPFSEPVADGPVIAHANQSALEGGATVEKCLDFAGKVTQRFGIPFLIMTYYNIPFIYGVDRFVSAMADRNLRGTIVPDLPAEKGTEYLNVMRKHDIEPILIFSPTTSPERMRYLASFARGFIYCVARKGVTGEKTDFSGELADYLCHCRAATSLPLALGFGIKDKVSIDFLRGKVEIAVIGTQMIRVMERDGIEAVGDFIRCLR